MKRYPQTYELVDSAAYEQVKRLKFMSFAP